MVIRRRNPGWQLDVTLPDGTRIRRQFTTKREAIEAAAELDHKNPPKRTPVAGKKSRSVASSVRSR